MLPQGDPVGRLVDALGRLPGVGERSATRLAFHIIREGPERAQELADALTDVTRAVKMCGVCMNFTDQPKCHICVDARRDRRRICVVEGVQDLRAIERSHEFRGLFHVLHGVLAPLDGIGPEDLKLDELALRVQDAPTDEPVDEVIVATNPSVEGEATALYIQRMMLPLGITVSRIASGMPVGGDFEFADPATISQAFAARFRMA